MNKHTMIEKIISVTNVTDIIKRELRTALKHAGDYAETDSDRFWKACRASVADIILQTGSDNKQIIALTELISCAYREDISFYDRFEKLIFSTALQRKKLDRFIYYTVNVVRNRIIWDNDIYRNLFSTVFIFCDAYLGGGDPTYKNITEKILDAVLYETKPNDQIVKFVYISKLLLELKNDFISNATEIIKTCINMQSVYDWNRAYFMLDLYQQLNTGRK